MKPLWMRGDSKPTMGVLLSKGKSEHGTHVHRANTTGGWRQRRECFIYKSKRPAVASDETRKDLPLEPRKQSPVDILILDTRLPDLGENAFLFFQVMGL